MHKTVPTFLFLAKSTAFILLSGMITHLIVMSLDFVLMPNGLFLDLRNNFIGSIFSPSMVPMIGVYGLFSLTVYFLWHRSKKAILNAHRKEIERKDTEMALRALQRLTGMLTDRISAQNAEILHQAEFRRKQGRPMSKKVEIASRNIAHALTSLSETAFVSPYTDSAPENIQDIENTLKSRFSATVDPTERIRHVQ